MTFIDRFRHRNSLAILSLLLIETFVYGPFLRSVGFYHDDWPVVAVYSLFGRSGLHTYYVGNRPVVGWLLIHLLSVIGVRPFGWHLLMLVTLTLTGVATFLTFCALWPSRRSLAWVTAVVVLLYPGFSQVSESLTFLPHYVSLLLFVLSLRATIAALKSKEWFWQLTSIAILLALFSYALTEYFIGLELFRLLVVAYQTRRSDLVRRAIVPYGTAWIAFIVWRGFFALTADNASYKDPSQGLHQLAHHPLGGMIDRISTFVHNLLFGSVLAWFRPIGPELVDRSGIGLFVEYALGALVFAIAFFMLRSFQNTEAPEDKFNPKLKLALGGLVVAGIPLLISVLRGEFTPFPSYSDRFILPFILVSSLLLALLLLRANSVTLTAGVLCLFAVFQLQTQISYRRDWNLQRSLFWQIRWRAPMLKPGTGVYLDGLPRTLLGNHNDGMLDMLYGAKSAPLTLTYYIFDLELYQQDLKRNHQVNLRSGSIVWGFVREYQFHGSIADSLVAYLSPAGVLYTMDGSSDAQPRYSGIADSLAHISAPDRVIEDKPRNPYGLLWIFGAEPAHDWTYYYQRAELKRQEHAWGDVAELGDAAMHSGYQPSEGTELLPFIEGYARVGRYDVAEQLTEQALKQSPEIERPLSALWNRVLSTQLSKPPVVVLRLGQWLDLGAGN